MNVGDYVRTTNQGIKRIDKIFENATVNKYGYEDKKNDYEYFIIRTDEIIKSSPNILELFEEHDLVVIEYYSLRYKERVTRLFEVDYKDKEFMTLKNAHCDFMLINNEFNDKDKKLKPIIKSIVTKEQFESMEYKVGE